MVAKTELFQQYRFSGAFYDKKAPYFCDASHALYASHATDFSLSCIETHTTASTDPNCTHGIISNVYMRCVPMTSYRMRTMRAMRACGRLPLHHYL
uniref:SFRICE_031371 n=1 Tax=Spodoptera frugiperda TaxID=7108 RepID=A0A2H1WQV0_SPOFR